MAGPSRPGDGQLPINLWHPAGSPTGAIDAVPVVMEGPGVVVADVLGGVGGTVDEAFAPAVPFARASASAAPAPRRVIQ